MKVWICDDVDQCGRLWKQAFAGRDLFHAWTVRKCFQDAFQRRPCFVVGEDAQGLAGLLPLSWIDETETLAFFPGETWHGKTWLEQNRVLARSADAFDELLEAVPAGTHLRYLDGDCVPPFAAETLLDEVGYLFFPARHGYCFERYLAGFRRKSLKHLLQEPESLYERGATFRYDFRPDVERLFGMNLTAFGEHSYFHDPRLLNGFERLIAELDRRGCLRVVTVVLGGEIAAVDVGAVWNNRYTLLAGGTSRDFPGVAKLINFHHLRIACRERFDVVDFLCGDFGWKRRFHLAERPLYQIELAGSRSQPGAVCPDADRPIESPVHA